MACRGEGDDEEAEDDGDPLANVEEGVLDRTEHGEDDRHADDVVDRVEHTREHHHTMVKVVEGDDGVEHFQESFCANTEKKDHRESEYDKTHS